MAGRLGGKSRECARVRLPVRVVLTGVFLLANAGAGSIGSSPILSTVLKSNEPQQYTCTATFGESEAYSQPYWLREPKDGWLYTVPDPRQVGDPENPPVEIANFRVNI